MAKRKKAPAEYVAYYHRSREDALRNVTAAFVLGETQKQLLEWHGEDRYGLVERGFRLCTVFKLAPYSRHNGEEPPTCGCYECAEWLYLREANNVQLEPV